MGMHCKGKLKKDALKRQILRVLRKHGNGLTMYWLAHYVNIERMRKGQHTCLQTSVAGAVRRLRHYGNDIKCVDFSDYLINGERYTYVLYE